MAKKKEELQEEVVAEETVAEEVAEPAVAEPVVAVKVDPVEAVKPESTLSAADVKKLYAEYVRRSGDKTSFEKIDWDDVCKKSEGQLKAIAEKFRA